MTTQLDCSIGIKKETTFGTPVVVDQFLEFTSESIDRKPTFVQGSGMRVGARVPRAARRSLGREDVNGAISLEAPTKGLGVLFEAALGAVTNTAVPAQAGVFQQVHTPNTTDPITSYTIQKGIPPLGGGATHAITFPGCVCSGFELSAKEGGLIEISTDWLGRETLTAPAYAVPSYPALMDVFSFVHGQIVIGGTPTAPTTTALATGGTAVANIKDFSLKWDNGLDGAGWNLGGAGKRSRKPALGAGAITGKMTAEYSDASLRDAFLAQTNLALLLTFTHPQVIGSTSNPALQLYVPAIRLESGVPSANGGDVIAPGIDFTGLDLAAGAPPIYVVYRSTDTAP